MRRALVALVVVVTVLAAPSGASALGTSQFTINPAPTAKTDPRTDRLVVAPKRGGTSHTRVVLANRLDRPLTLRLEVEPVQLADGGSASLGGDDRAVAWVDLDRERLTLAPQESAAVKVTIHVPRGASEAERTVGILAEPIAEPGTSTSVVQRLALVMYIRPHGTAPQPIVLILVALAIVLAVMSAIVWRAPSLLRRAA